MDAETGHRWRWVILAFVVASVIINNFDRQMIAMLKPFIQGEFGWGDTEYGRLGAVFQLGAVASLVGAGWMLDRLGLRIGYAVGNGLWSAVTLFHVGVSSFGGMLALRGVLGASESIQTPAAVKAAATYFPPKEAGLALGIVNAAPNVGAIIVPLLIPVMGVTLGWRNSFLVVGAVGFVWLAAWLAFRPAGMRTPDPKPAALVLPEARGDRWADLLKLRAVWGFMAAKVLTDQTWWLLMFWLPDFFARTFRLSATGVALPTALAYLLAMAGALTGGLLASRLIARGMPVARARMTLMVGAGVLALGAPLALFAGSVWAAALLVGATLFAHQAFSTNLFAVVTDAFPARRVASVVALGALAGNLWGAAMLELVGRWLDAGGTYLPLFVVAGGSYLAGAAVVRGTILRRARGGDAAAQQR